MDKRKHAYRLCYNESPLAHSNDFLDILKKINESNIRMYNSQQSDSITQLKKLISIKENITDNNILFGNGATQLIEFLINTLCDSQSNIITTDVTFNTYRTLSEKLGIKVKISKLVTFTYSKKNILDLIDKQTKIIFICNPNNPTGTYWNRESIIDFMESVDQRIYVIFDEAYAEFIDTQDYMKSSELINKYKNIISLRTFSKAYGLAGLRLGYLISNKNNIRTFESRSEYYPQFYKLNCFALLAAYHLMLEDNYLNQVKLIINEAKVFVRDFFLKNKIEFIMGEGNFLLIKTPVSDKVIAENLEQEGFLVKAESEYTSLDKYIRVTIANKKIMRKFCKKLLEIYGRGI